MAQKKPDRDKLKSAMIEKYKTFDVNKSDIHLFEASLDNMSDEDLVERAEEVGLDPEYYLKQ